MNEENKQLQQTTQPNGQTAVTANSDQPEKGTQAQGRPGKKAKPGKNSGQAERPSNEQSGGSQTREIARYSAMFGANYAQKDAWTNLRDGMKINLQGQTTITPWDIDTINGNVNFIVTDFIPTVGYAIKPADPINIWANQIMSALKSRMNKVVGINYDTSDILAYTIAGDSLAMWFTFLCNAVQLSNTYTMKNVSFPEGMLRAIGIDPLDIRKNKTLWCSWIEDISLKLQSFYIPRQDVWNLRHQGLVSCLYSDSLTGSGDPRGNYIIFRPTGYWAYDPAKKPSTAQNGFDTVTYVRPPYMDKLMTIDDVVQFTNQLIQPLWGDQTVIDMTGDLQRLFPVDATLALVVPDLEAKVTVGASLSLLLSLHNANIYPGAIPYIKEVVPDPKKGSPYLKCVATSYAQLEQFSMTYQLMDANIQPGVDPTDEEKLNAVRWKYNVGSPDYVDPTKEDLSAMGLKDFTSEVITGVTLYNNNLGADPSIIGSFELSSHIRTITSKYDATTKSYFVAEDVTKFLYSLLPVTSFDTMPLLYVVTSEKVGTNGGWVRHMMVFGNQFNAVEVGDDIIHNLNYALNLMMFPFNVVSPMQ